MIAFVVGSSLLSLRTTWKDIKVVADSGFEFGGKWSVVSGPRGVRGTRMVLGGLFGGKAGGQGAVSKMAIVPPETHHVLGTPMEADFAKEGLEMAMVGMGCFWGAERVFWQLPGVYTTAVGYSAGTTENPSYRDVCSGRTGHAEVVRVVFDPKKISYEQILARFWEKHDSRQLNRQGNDVGTQYRSGIYYYSDEQKKIAEASRDKFQSVLDGKGKIVTEIAPAATFYFAEDYHQQYLSKNPGGYCGLGGLPGVCYPAD
uniref:peptide-methionine (S)-S-oxide reductase n=1 Tax=Compsopogon caeruleus TaxID=31354 RepID=A0A7S1TCB2_9RHOD|mmetsp:Transcript_16343/g.33266  ORF Transcript_16343/g.33266 Transcript_16343/m.33266 type:complete len:258 (+) Transcript_16343:351-1124(+)|eukprot:CAMPEP_0184689264 /NCGR_PEP_ID=MMETSP0312-20130426/30560_1 /TAXON_ID=31354 /ORGANISM="Compsopogon coeruleus, Strain SAG 36.94" /LENGTH=257 /DNA_ID=CAMNT_0027146595 /DNA_START=297 /DNA_END=1070 /DNA_ORIENTATION=+